MEFRPIDVTTGVRDCALKLLEESSEACEAMKALGKAASKGSGREYERVRREALEEVADVMQTAADLLSACGCTSLEWTGAAYSVRRRNLERGRHELFGSGSLRVTWEGCDD